MAVVSPAKFLFAIVVFTISLNFVQAQSNDFERSEIVGRKQDTRHASYEAMTSKKSPLIGFEFGLSRMPPFLHISALRPIFKDETTARAALGRLEDGIINNKKVKTPVHTKHKVVAKEGYAVSKIIIQYGLWVDSMKVHFAKIKGDGLDLTDTYASESYGSTEADGDYTPLDTEGRLIVGVNGTTDGVIATGFGLVYSGKLPPKSTKAQSPPNGSEAKAKQNPGLDAAAKPAPNKIAMAKPTLNIPDPGRATEQEPKAKVEPQKFEALVERQNVEVKAEPQNAVANQQIDNVVNNGGGNNLVGWIALAFVPFCLFLTIGFVLRLLICGSNSTSRSPAVDENTPTGQQPGDAISEIDLKPILAELTPNERIVWTGLQSSRVLWQGRLQGTCLLGTMAMLTGIFALFLSGKAGGLLGNLLPTFALASGMALIVGSIVLNFGFFRQNRRVVYALTNRRALVYRPAFFSEGHVDTYGPQILQHMKRRDYWLTKNAGDLIFHTERTITVTHFQHGGSTMKKDEQRFGFIGIDNVRDVEKLVRETLVNPLVDKLLV
jgi:hypothetical protein